MNKKTKKFSNEYQDASKYNQQENIPKGQIRDHKTVPQFHSHNLPSIQTSSMQYESNSRNTDMHLNMSYTKQHNNSQQLRRNSAHTSSIEDLSENHFPRESFNVVCQDCNHIDDELTKLIKEIINTHPKKEFYSAKLQKLVINKKSTSDQFNMRCDQMDGCTLSRREESSSSKTSRTHDKNVKKETRWDEKQRRDSYDMKSEEFKKWYFLWKKQGERYIKVTEIVGDLFTAPKDYSLAHCVGADLRMGSGIAVGFRQNFKNVTNLLDQRKRTGEVAILEEGERFIYYLITKKLSTGKPLLVDLISCLIAMKEHCIQNGVKNIAIPRIGCGLDRLEWSEVKLNIEYIFSDLDINIRVYNFNQDQKEHPEAVISHFKNKCYIKHVRDNLENMESGSGLIYFGYEDGDIDETGKNLYRKFNLPLYNRQQQNIGDVLSKWIGRDYVLYELIIGSKKTDQFYYTNLEKCLKRLRSTAKTDGTYYIGLQAFQDGNYNLTMEQVITVLKNIFAIIEIQFYVFWPKELEIYHEWHNQSDSF